MKIKKQMTVHEEVEIKLPLYSVNKGFGWNEYFFIREDTDKGAMGITFIQFDNGKWNVANWISDNGVNDALEATPITEDEFMLAWKELLQKVLMATNVVSPIDPLPSVIDLEPEASYHNGKPESKL